MRIIDWTPDGIDSLVEILDYYRDKAGENIANNIYAKIIKEIELLEVEEVRTKQTQELKDIGIMMFQTALNMVKKLAKNIKQ